jgi:hypothetical protein
MRYLRRVVGVELDLVDSRRDLEPRVGKELLKVLDGEVGNTNVLDAARLGELLQLRPGVTEVPVGVVLAEVLRVGRRWPVLQERVRVAQRIIEARRLTIRYRST